MKMLEKKPKRDILGYEEADGREEERGGRETFNPVPPIYLTLLVFLLALTARLVVLFFFTEPDNPGVAWYADVWHHWQIAYLSKEVGFKEGFLRLWDFKGMEYYWGLLHPLVLIVGFIVSGSISILVPRMVSAIFSSLAIALVFLIVAQHFNKKAAFASILFLTLTPVSLFSDTLGIQEPLGLFFLFLGIYLFSRNAFFAGFSWMLAGMVRAEYWLFGAGLLLAVLIREKSFDRKTVTLLGYGIPCIFYLKYLLDYTGNPIYPIYWNYLAIVAGQWFEKSHDLVLETQALKHVCQILASLFFIGGLIVLWKRCRGYLLLLLGFANFTFIFFVFGFGDFLYSYGRLQAEGFLARPWVGKLFAWPWGFLGVLAAIFLLYFLPKKAGKLGTLLGTLIFLAILGATQLTWPSINYHYGMAKGPLELKKRIAADITEKYNGRGKILIPDNQPVLTYALVYYEGIPGNKLVSSLYSPFYYHQGEDVFAEWETFREKIIEWLKKNDIELFVYAFGGGTGRDVYQKMLEREEGKLFKLVLVNERGDYQIYEVTINKD